MNKIITLMLCISVSSMLIAAEVPAQPTNKPLNKHTIIAIVSSAAAGILGIAGIIAYNIVKKPEYTYGCGIQMKDLIDLDPNEHIPSEYGTTSLIDYAFRKKAPDEIIFHLMNKGARRESCSLVNKSQFDVCKRRKQELIDLVDCMNAWESDCDIEIANKHIIPSITKENVRYKKLSIETESGNIFGTLLELAFYKGLPETVIQTIINELFGEGKTNEASPSINATYPEKDTQTMINIMHNISPTTSNNIFSDSSDSSGGSYTSIASETSETNSIFSGSKFDSSSGEESALEQLSDGFSDDGQVIDLNNPLSNAAIHVQVFKPEMRADEKNQILE